MASLLKTISIVSAKLNSKLVSNAPLTLIK